MNKSQLIEAMAEELKVPVSTSSDIVDTILDSMTGTLVAGDNVEIRGFGSFTVRNYTLSSRSSVTMNGDNLLKI
jgi:integration host factor subunit beta